VCRHSCLLQPACCEGYLFPPSLVFSVPHPLYYVSFVLLLLIIQFFYSFFPGWGVSLDQGCLWKYCMLFSSPCGPRLPKPCGCCCLVAV
jgi:hypothetical protein